MQIVGYRTAPADAGPALLLADAGDVERVSLDRGDSLAYTLGDRHCAGVLDPAGPDDHEPCDRETTPYCRAHTSRWPCARCRGECALPVEACREEHVLYLAAFAPATFKVGVTRSWRLERRLREQGADRGAHLRTVTDGRVARQIEADIAAEVGDSVRVPTKIDGLHRSVDERAWEQLLAGFEPLATYEFEYALKPGDRPVAETLATGDVRGTKGRVLVLEYQDSTYAVDLRDLVGREILEDDLDRQLQSSLGAFQ